MDRPIKQIDTPVGGTVSTTTLVYQGASDRLSREIVAAASTSTRGYWYGGFAERLTINDTTAGRLSYVYDPHGSVSLLLDQANVVKRSYGYSGYGGSIGSVTKNAAGFTDPNRYQYTGKRWDAATGSYDIGLRRYTPGSSRWLQQDLYYDALDNLGLSADPMLANRYMFAGANPVNFIELDGHVLENGGEGGVSQRAMASSGASPRLVGGGRCRLVARCIPLVGCFAQLECSTSAGGQTGSRPGYSCSYYIRSCNTWGLWCSAAESCKASAKKKASKKTNTCTCSCNIAGTACERIPDSEKQLRATGSGDSVDSACEDAYRQLTAQLNTVMAIHSLPTGSGCYIRHVRRRAVNGQKVPGERKCV